MKQIPQPVDVQEPIGIVIADGGRPEPTPKFLAYVWGPAPEPMPIEATETKAA
jgi:hypothetical protein